MAQQSAAPAKPRALLLGSQGLGRGDDGVGLTILHNFLKSLVTNPLRPDKIVCWNAGVKLLAADSPVIGALQDLEGVGVEILACKTCVDYFGLQSIKGSIRIRFATSLGISSLSARKATT